MHDLTVFPFMRMVQIPQSPFSQPHFTSVNPLERKNFNKDCSGWTAEHIFSPFTVSSI
jgi:hypothetical protein